jgi:hypothetical protein
MTRKRDDVMDIELGTRTSNDMESKIRVISKSRSHSYLLYLLESKNKTRPVRVRVVLQQRLPDMGRVPSRLIKHWAASAQPQVVLSFLPSSFPLQSCPSAFSNRFSRVSE